MILFKILKWFYIPYWRYLLEKPCNFTKFWCRVSGHKCGPIWYNVNGLEPNMRCKDCNDHL